MDSVFCPMCDEIRLTPYHRCPPQWIVVHEDDDTPFEDLGHKAIYARDQHAAAEKFAQSWFSDECDYSDLTLHVRVIDYPNLENVSTVYVQGYPTIDYRSQEISLEPYTPDQDSED